MHSIAHMNGSKVKDGISKLLFFKSCVPGQT